MSGGGTFLSSSYLGLGFLGPSPSRSGRYVQHPVDVRAEAPMPIAPALDELYESPLLEEVKVSLDGSGASGEPSGQGLHARPAEAGLVVGVICEGAVGRDHLRGNPREYQIAYLGYARKSGSHRHDQPPRGFATGPHWRC